MVSYLISNVRIFDGLELYDRPHAVHIADGKIQFALSISYVHVFRGVEEAKTALQFGVTTLLDMHNVPANAKYMKELSKSSSELPQIYGAFYAATIANGWPRAIVRHTTDDPVLLASLVDYPELSTPESARAFVAANRKEGADFIKLMQETVIAEARRYGLQTFAHATSLRETMLVLEAGVSALAHQFFDKPHDDALVQAYKKSNAFLVPTLVAISSMMGMETTKTWIDSRALDARLPSQLRQVMCECMSIAQPTCRADYAYETIKKLKSEGIDIVCGTDSGPNIHGTAAGPALHLELQLYVTKCGFSPVEALRTATGVSANRLGLNDRGRILPGRRGDCLLVKGNPCKDIDDTFNISHVWKEGVLCKSQDEDN
ncbi:hypothetical protein M409DRAFT_62152 [Zasmidium cellare ATCC 36951]|uniref:Amidohydrolase-related domain-containing protein n=1 Tax=Zasmidium cellare ATCC 36951 TaxID=1080233 RepID=A0A6A6D8H5_ZASCE|nr:uncharacterized protein M409DRAFT_62152 [Zasmidium cellare ATCC 36951]KAF2173946.1 hypothetical protein M409DRAFT_62152 [Zasmidium cellare ATCC 36951]